MKGSEYGKLCDSNYDISNSSILGPNDMNFEVINSKLDRLMQIVALTEKKPSVQMQNLLKLNDKEDEMKGFSKQVNLELQNIIQEQNQQLHVYREQQFQKLFSTESVVMNEREMFYSQIKKQNEVIKYLVKENSNLREKYKIMSLDNINLISTIKSLSGNVIQPPHTEENQAMISETEEVSETTRLQKKLSALEKFMLRVMKSYNTGSGSEKEEIFKLKNQLEQNQIEMAEQFEIVNELRKQIATSKTHILTSTNAKNIKANNARGQQVPKQNNLSKQNSKTQSNKMVTSQTPSNENNTRQTRGKRKNYQDILKEYDLEIEESSGHQEDEQEEEKQSNNFRKGIEKNNNNGRQNKDSNQMEQIDDVEIEKKSIKQQDTQISEKINEKILPVFAESKIKRSISNILQKKKRQSNEQNQDHGGEEEEDDEQISAQEQSNHSKYQEEGTHLEREEDDKEEVNDNSIENEPNDQRKKGDESNSESISAENEEEEEDREEGSINQDDTSDEEFEEDENSEIGSDFNESSSDSEGIAKKRKKKAITVEKEKDKDKKTQKPKSEKIVRKPKMLAASDLPKKKKTPSQAKQKLTKQLIRKNQEQQDRLFNHVEMIIDF